MANAELTREEMERTRRVRERFDREMRVMDHTNLLVLTHRLARNLSDETLEHVMGWRDLGNARGGS